MKPWAERFYNSDAWRSCRDSFLKSKGYGSDSDEAPYTAIGFRAKKAGGTYKYIWLYKVKFAIPDENYTTKGDSIEFTTPEIVGQFIKRSDGLWKAEHVAEPTNSVATAWFTSVREPNNAGS